MSRNVVWMHDPPPKSDQLRLGIGGIVFTHGIGATPLDGSGFDHRQHVAEGVDWIDRLNYGYDGMGTIPPRSLWDSGVTRIVNWIANTPTVRIVTIGNEPNMGWERPGYGGPDEEVVTPDVYAEYWKKVWTAVKLLFPDVKLALAPPAPWNTETKYVGNENGNWVLWWVDLIEQIIDDFPPDVVCLHAYTHGTEPWTVTSKQLMTAPGFTNYYYHWLHVKQIWDVMPGVMKEMPLYITETNGDGPWSLAPDNGWMSEVAMEVERWRQEGADVRGVAAYCWPDRGRFGIGQNIGAQESIRRAAALDITWGPEPPDPIPPGGEDMDKIFETSFNEGFYDWIDPKTGRPVGEVTIPRYSFPAWVQGHEAGVFHRPEYDAKDSTIGQPEVLTRPYAANFFVISATMDAAIVFEIPVEPGNEIRAEVQSMGVGTGGMAIGISTDPLTDGPHIVGYFDGITFKDWWSTDLADWKERQWRKLNTPMAIATGDKVWVVLLGRARDAGPLWATHWDEFVVWSDGAVAPPPPPNPDDPSSIRKIAASLRVHAVELDDLADVAEGGGVPRSPVTEARDLLTAALG